MSDNSMRHDIRPRAHDSGGTAGSLQRPVFIGGAGRSGTTLLRSLLSAHPRICVSPETHFMARAEKWGLRDRDAPLDFERFWSRYTASVRFRDLGVDADYCRRLVEDAGPPTFRSIFEAVHDDTVVDNPLPCNVMSRRQLPGDKGWWGFSFRDVPARSAQVKEPHFFSTSPDWRRELPRYEALFDEPPGALYCDFEHVHANKSVGGRKQHHRFDNPPIVLEWVRRMLPGVWKRIVSRYSPSVDAPPRLSPPFERMIVNVPELEIRALETLMEKDLGRCRRTHAAAIEDQVSAVNGVEAIR